MNSEESKKEKPFWRKENHSITSKGIGKSKVVPMEDGIVILTPPVSFKAKKRRPKNSEKRG